VRHAFHTIALVSQYQAVSRYRSWRIESVSRRKAKIDFRSDWLTGARKGVISSPAERIKWGIIPADHVCTLLGSDWERNIRFWTWYASWLQWPRLQLPLRFVRMSNVWCAVRHRVIHPQVVWKTNDGCQSDRTEMRSASCSLREKSLRSRDAREGYRDSITAIVAVMLRSTIFCFLWNPTIEIPMIDNRNFVIRIFTLVNALYPSKRRICIDVINTEYCWQLVVFTGCFLSLLLLVVLLQIESLRWFFWFYPHQACISSCTRPSLPFCIAC